MSAELWPIHSSKVVHCAKARNMSYKAMTSDTRETLERIALEIFTDMTNAGNTLQATLAAIYLSGLAHAIELQEVPQ